MIPVITISREFGSGGHSIGLKVSKALNIPFLDGEIIGKAAEKALNILIHADINFRKDRILKRYGEIKNVGIEKRILKKDKQRSTYYKYYTDQTWGAYKNYDLALDSGRIGEENCVKMICDLANIF